MSNHDDRPIGEPNAGDEANLTKWGWPSPALIKRHDPKRYGNLWTGPTDEQQECPF